MSDFVRVYNTKGELVRVPKHYLTHPILKVGLSLRPPTKPKTPTAKPAGGEPTGDAGETKEGK